MNDDSPSGSFLLWGVFLLALGASAVGFWRQSVMSDQGAALPLETLELPVIGQPVQFTLTDSSDAPFGSTDLSGKVWVASFFFTRCAGICPVLAERMKSLQDRYESAPDFHLVSISVDPEVDTPARLAVYGKSVGADPDRWHLLWGEKEDIVRISQEGFLMSTGGEGTDSIQHSWRIAVVDRLGRIRGYHDGTDPTSVEPLEAAIEHLLAEEEDGQP